MTHIETEPYRRGVQRAIDAAQLRPPSKPQVPEHRCGLATSILASPRLLDWPLDVRQWIHRRCPFIRPERLGL